MKRLAMALCMAFVLSACACAVAAPADRAASESKTVDTSKSGDYVSGKWSYAYTIGAKGSKSERRHGDLLFDGKPVAGAAEYDRIKTPWGVMQYFGDRGMWNTGWLLKQTYDTPTDGKKGKLLPSPEEWAKRIADRKKALVADVEHFELLLRFWGPADKPYYSLTLSVPPTPRSPASRADLGTPIDKETALKIIDWLADSGALGSAEDVSNVDRLPPAGPCYVMYVNGGKLFLMVNLGWEMPMLKSLYGLRGLLTGAAATQMDMLMGRLSGHIREWTGKPYEPPK